MAGIFGVTGKENEIDDAYLGTFYLQHRAQDYSGFGSWESDDFTDTHKGLVKEKFANQLERLKGRTCLGCVASDRQPFVEASRDDTLVLGLDGNIINHDEVRNRLLDYGISFSGFKDPNLVSDSVLASKIISSERTFEDGIEKLVSMIKGDFAIAALTKRGLFACRGYGRKPLVLGNKDGSYAVASESNAFVNTGFEIIRDVFPGEIVKISPDGIETVRRLDLRPKKLGTFEWIYTAYPSSVIDSLEVAEVRKRIGRALARKTPVDADIVSPIPNSGRWHAIGYAEASEIPYAEAFIRYDYSDRSFTPGSQEARDEVARTKLIPVRGVIRGKRIVIVDDSIVRGTQLLNRVDMLRSFGAKEVHARIACPPLMRACQYGKTTRKDSECIARRISDEMLTTDLKILTEEVRKKLKLDSLTYASVEDLEEATGYTAQDLCLECWEK